MQAILVHNCLLFYRFDTILRIDFLPSPMI
nr:MAG TPA: hypothetical protein [Caudoviricetes sp.]